MGKKSLQTVTQRLAVVGARLGVAGHVSFNASLGGVAAVSSRSDDPAESAVISATATACADGANADREGVELRIEHGARPAVRNGKQIGRGDASQRAHRSSDSVSQLYVPEFYFGWRTCSAPTVDEYPGER